MEVLEQTLDQPADVGKPAQNKVQIKIDDKPYTIERGRHAVRELKRLAGIPQADILAEVIDGKLVDLKDDGFVIIKGHEVFISRPCDSASS